MVAVQAVWYLEDGTIQPSGRKENFKQIERPLDVLNFI
jgi:putative hydrolase of the HAD superfamily